MKSFQGHGNGGQEIITINEYPKGGGKYLVFVTLRNKNMCPAKPKVTITYQTSNSISSQIEIAPQAMDCSNGGGVAWFVGCFEGDRMTGGGFTPKNHFNQPKYERNPRTTKQFSDLC